MTDAPSRTQIDKLGQRLARPSYHATTDDLTLLEQFRAEHSEPLRKASEALRSLDLQPTSRTKTTGTIVDKLRREHPMRLTQMEDIAGRRVVVEMTRNTQDELVQRILAALPEGAKATDRRVHPATATEPFTSLPGLLATKSRFRSGRAFRISGRRWSSDSPTPGDARSVTGSLRITLRWRSLKS